MTENTNTANQLTLKQDIPHIIKYMGSKKNLIENLVEAINEVYDGECICDLFAGTAILSGAIGNSTPMISNDIQEYSSVLGKTYLGNYNWAEYDNLLDKIVGQAYRHVNYVHRNYSELNFQYHERLTLSDFNEIEQQQQKLINYDFNNIKNHLFIKNYSGTYWSFEQCLWIDALRATADEYIGTSVYYPILASIMFAMAYNAQSTGHYAQYRKANNLTSMNDILVYRRKEILPYFQKKFNELMTTLSYNDFSHHITALDYKDCLDSIPTGVLVYADPPYTFVHYSRFYHALETLVKYDYPEVLFKGRYRNDRHQSPFCKRTEVVNAFSEMFLRIKNKKAKLVLSYSNSGMISLEQIIETAKNILGSYYKIIVKAVTYKHSTMGRLEDKDRDVKEYFIIAKPAV